MLLLLLLNTIPVTAAWAVDRELLYIETPPRPLFPIVTTIAIAIAALNNILGGPRCQRKDLAAAAWQVVAETRDPKAEHIRDWKSIDFLMKSIEKTSILSARTSGTEKVSISY